MKHKENFISILAANINSLAESTSSESEAFVRVAADWLNYEIVEENYVDGAGDKGIDFWFQTNDGYDFFQVKSHILKNGTLDLSLMDKSGVNDIKRIKDFLESESIPDTANSKVKDLFRNWSILISKRKMAEEPEPIDINIYLIIFAEGLTEPAKEEFDNYKIKNESIEIRSIPINIQYHLIDIDKLIYSKWLQDNQNWYDSNGVKRNKIDLTPESNKDNEPQWIPGHNSAVFYCRAHDLVTAYSDFGYQLFEPNVRAQIKKSKVNAAIRRSLSHASSRKQFRFLNNGVTLVSKSFTKPNNNKKSFSIIEPGIINGLQTVVSLYDAYNEIDNQEKEHFDRNCYVLVRLLTENAVNNVNSVVVATNTQNPMQDRNLKSNAEEQIQYEKLFANIGWFYERKQGAWNAYSSDPHRWRTLSNIKKTNFAYQNGSGRSKYRKVDNEELAQTWLAFIGMSNEAVHRKRDLFDDSFENLYKLAFLFRPQKHGVDYSFDNKEILINSINASPDPYLLIVSYLTREFARIVPLSTRKAREKAIEQNKIDTNQPKENIDAKLNDDLSYVKARVINGMSFLFVELVGYALFKAKEKDIHISGQKILSTRSLQDLNIKGFIDTNELIKIREGELEPNDIIGIIWHVFEHIIDESLAGTWKESFLSASPRSRFNYSKETRNRFIKGMNDLDQFMKKSQLTKIWASSIPEKTGLYEYISNILS